MSVSLLARPRRRGWPRALVVGPLLMLPAGLLLISGSGWASPSCGPLPNPPSPLPCPIATTAPPQASSTPPPPASSTPPPAQPAAPIQPVRAQPSATDSASPNPAGANLSPGSLVIPSPATGAGNPVPLVAPGPSSVSGGSSPSALVALQAPIPLSGALALVIGGLLTAAMLAVTLATSYRAQVGSARPRRRHPKSGPPFPSTAAVTVHTFAPSAPEPSTPPEGVPMSSTRRWRLLTGGGLLLLAAIVGVIGWFKLSGEPLLNRQVPYLASTGIAVMLLAVAGGALLVAEQMRTDDRRLDEIEDAVRTLAQAMSGSIEKPARLRAPATGEDDPEITTELPPAKPRRTRTPR